MKSFEDRLKAAPILIVDDAPVNVVLLESLLDSRGYTNVKSTTDPFSVLPLHQKHRFVLILLDMQMPGLDGLGVMKQLQADAPDQLLPVLVITAQTDVDLRLKALEGGARDYITKPFIVAELSQRIRNLLEAQLAYRDRMDQAAALETKVIERTREVTETQHEILNRLKRAGEFRERESGNHVRRVSQSARALANAAGLDANQVGMIEHASSMYDVGKMGVPDDILLHNGPLQGDSLDRMRQHVLIGASILDGHAAPVMRMACKIARSHHERWDGTGYTEGLAGEAIPLEARIVAVCDVFDALTSPRLYRKAWTHEAAADYIRSGAGTHFDPALAAHFLKILPHVLRIREQFPD